MDAEINLNYEDITLDKEGGGGGGGGGEGLREWRWGIWYYCVRIYVKKRVSMNRSSWETEI